MKKKKEMKEIICYLRKPIQKQTLLIPKGVVTYRQLIKSISNKILDHRVIKRNPPHGVIIAQINKNEITIGWAIMHQTDLKDGVKWNKKLALKIARGRIGVKGNPPIRMRKQIDNLIQRLNEKYPNANVKWYGKSDGDKLIAFTNLMHKYGPNSKPVQHYLNEHQNDPAFLQRAKTVKLGFQIK